MCVGEWIYGFTACMLVNGHMGVLCMLVKGRRSVLHLGC